MRGDGHLQGPLCSQLKSCRVVPSANGQARALGVEPATVSTARVR
ncbi:MAG: hypothetical protein R2864_07275 [Syntrophotaleaceae bacterium]